MKIFLISDTHFGIYPIHIDKWLDTMRKYFDEFFIPLLKEKVQPGDVLIHLGDLFDNRTQIPIHVTNYVQELLEELGAILPVHVLIGNHDIYTKSSNNINSPKPFKWIPNINIYESPTVINFGDTKCLMMPWIETKKEQIKVLKENIGCDYLFCHSDLNGAVMHLKSVAHKNLDKIDVEEFKNYGKVFSGHIHLVQKNKNFTFVGGPFQMDRNDIGNQKGIFILDVDSGDEEFVPNKLSPQFKKVIVQSEDDVIKLEDIDTSKDYIDLEISNALLINSRKVRRKLEGIVQKGSFSSIEYINDIVTEDAEGKEVKLKSTENIDLSNISLTDFEKVIIEYIHSSEWESEVIKHGVLTELNEVLKVYNDSYKLISED